MSRLNPIFVLPISEAVPEHHASSRSSTPIKRTPGRGTGTGSANIQSPSTATVPRIPILGFQIVSLFKMITLAGHVPPFHISPKKSTLEEIRRTASRPIVVFPECTTSNGRGLLRFADIFHQDVPVKKYQVFIACVRYVLNLF